MVAALFALTFGRMLGRRRAYWLTISGIALYVLLVGADAAVVRAGIMGGLLATALYLGRRATAYVSLLVSAMILTMINPLALWDVGFQLSFAATLSLILFTPAVKGLFERGLTPILSQERAWQATHFLNNVLIVTLAAQVLTIPLVAYHFGRLSLVAPLTNLLILPAQPPVMVLGGAASLIGLVPFLEPAAQVLAWAPWLCLAYTNAVVQWMANWPFASLPIGRTSAVALALCYAGLVAGAWFALRRGAPPPRTSKAITIRQSTMVLLGMALVAATLAWLAGRQLPDGRLHVAFLDVGQGDAILITSPQGRQILVDGGPSPAALTSALGREMPFWDRSLDLVVMTHADADHITGLVEVLERYRIQAWLDNGQSAGDALYAECVAHLQESAVTRRVVHAGDRLELEPGIALEVLHPTGEILHGSEAGDNNSSLVLRLVWGDADFLLTGDIEAEAEHTLLDSGQSLAADVLKVSHHGSGDASTARFLGAVGASYGVISVGADNRFDHPHPSVLERMGQVGELTVFRTDEQGTVEFTTDGRRLWIETRR